MATARATARVTTIAAAHVLVLASLAMVARSGGDKIVAPGATNGGNTALVRADSLYMASQMAAAASQAIKSLRQIQTPDLPFVGASAPTCTPATTTGGTDTNNNGVPDDRTLQYTTATCTQNSAGTTTTVSGSVRTQDLGELYAFRVTYNNLVVTATKGDSTVKSTGVSTSAPLTMSASCNSEPVFNLGTLNGSVSGSAIGAVSVRFVGCGGIPSKS